MHNSWLYLTKTLQLGAVLSLSGAAAAYGGEALEGAQFALKQAKAEGLPFEVEFIVQDDKSDKTEAAKVARALIDADGVAAILGPAISPSALSVGKLAEERQVPIVGTSPTLDAVTNSADYDRKYVFRACFNDAFQGGVMAGFVANTLKKKKAAIIYDKTLSYSIGLAKTFKDRFTALGGAVLHEENYSVKDTDFNTLIDKVAAYDVDVLFIPGWDEHVGPMMKQAGNRWAKFTLVGGDGWPTERLVQLSGGNVGESYALSHFIADDPTPVVKAFSEAFRRTLGKEPTPFHALGHDAMMLLLDAAKRATDLEGQAIRDALAQTEGLALATGTFSFDKHRNPIKEGVVVNIKPTGFTFRERVKP